MPPASPKTSGRTRQASQTSALKHGSRAGQLYYRQPTKSSRKGGSTVGCQEEPGPIPQGHAKAASMRYFPHVGVGLRFSIFELDGSLKNIKLISVVTLLRQLKQKVQPFTWAHAYQWGDRAHKQPPDAQANILSLSPPGQRIPDSPQLAATWVLPTGQLCWEKKQCNPYRRKNKKLSNFNC